MTRLFLEPTKMKQKLLRCVALTLGNTGECARLVSWQSSMRRPRHHTWSSLSRGEAVDAISVEGKHPVQIQAQLEPSQYNLMMDKCLGGTALLWNQGCLWSIRSYFVYRGSTRFYKAAFYMTNADI